MSIKPLSTRNLELLAERYKIPPAFLEKDWYTQHILGVMAECRSDRFQLVFGGGTSLSKGYQLIKRFSEDIDFKVQMLQPNSSRTNRRDYGERLLQAILDSSPELKLAGEVTKHDRALFVKFDIAYPSQYSIENALRPCIQVEVSFKEPALAPEPRSLASLVTQMQEQAPEIGEFPCVSLAETGADKVASLTWRVFAKAPNDPGYDPRNIRHLYDLAYLSPQIADREDWATLSIESLETDLLTRAKSLNSSSRELLAGLLPRLTNEMEYRQHYEDFVQALSYEEQPLGFGEAVDRLSILTEKLLERPVVKAAGPERGSDEQRRWAKEIEAIVKECVERKVLPRSEVEAIPGIKEYIGQKYKVVENRVEGYRSVESLDGRGELMRCGLDGKFEHGRGLTAVDRKNWEETREFVQKRIADGVVNAKEKRESGKGFDR